MSQESSELPSDAGELVALAAKDGVGFADFTRSTVEGITSESVLHWLEVPDAAGTAVVPGDLQTPDYTTALFKEHYRHTDSEIERGLQIRSGRAAIWAASGGQRVFLVAPEALEAQEWVSPRVMRGQLHALAEAVVEQANSRTSVRILPPTVPPNKHSNMRLLYRDGLENVGQAFVYHAQSLAEFAVPETRIPDLERSWGQLLESSLSPTDSLEVIFDAMKNVGSWRKSMASGSHAANCVEVSWDRRAGMPDAIRDSKQPRGRVLELGNTTAGFSLIQFAKQAE